MTPPGVLVPPKRVMQGAVTKGLDILSKIPSVQLVFCRGLGGLI